MRRREQELKVVTDDDCVTKKDNQLMGEVHKTQQAIQSLVLNAIDVLKQKLDAVRLNDETVETDDQFGELGTATCFSMLRWKRKHGLIRPAEHGLLSNFAFLISLQVVTIEEDREIWTLGINETYSMRRLIIDISIPDTVIDPFDLTQYDPLPN
nr:DNA-directed RNA polymerases II, IV and V subunit 3-like [Tanacetum cinerariifolium]